MKKTLVACRIEPEDLDRLKKVAKQRDIGESELIRQAIKLYIKAKYCPTCLRDF